MNNLQAKSAKISKKPRKVHSGERSFKCGGCQRTYKSYPALYLHIRKKHQGIRPPNTQCQKPPEYQSVIKASTSQKFVGDIDDVNTAVLDLEKAEESLFDFLGDNLLVISPFCDKPTLEHVKSKILSNVSNPDDEHLSLIKRKVEEFFTQNEYEQLRRSELDYEKLKETAPKSTIMILVWFLLWFGRYSVKLDFLHDLSLIFSRIWKVLSQKDLSVQDLDNKLVWNELNKECQLVISNLTYFQGKERLMLEFSKRLCQFIGKSFEE